MGYAGPPMASQLTSDVAPVGPSKIMTTCVAVGNIDTETTALASTATGKTSGMPENAEGNVTVVLDPTVKPVEPNCIRILAGV